MILDDVMNSHYEDVIKKFMPAVKAGIARELSKKHNMTQTEISGLLGVTQAEVSKYLSRMYSQKLKKFEKGIPESVVSSVAESLVGNREKEAQRKICALCYKNFGYGCSLKTE